MSRKQIRIPGTEDKQYPEVEKAADAYVEARDERMELTKRENLKKHELMAIMKAHKLKVYKFTDNAGEVVEARIDEGDPKVSVRKTGEAEPEIGEGIPSSSDSDRKPAGMDGLIAQAMAAQDEAGVHEDAEGDVVAPDKAAPKKPRTGKGKKA